VNATLWKLWFIYKIFYEYYLLCQPLMRYACVIWNQLSIITCLICYHDRWLFVCSADVCDLNLCSVILLWLWGSGHQNQKHKSILLEWWYVPFVAFGMRWKRVSLPRHVHYVKRERIMEKPQYLFCTKKLFQLYRYFSSFIVWKIYWTKLRCILLAANTRWDLVPHRIDRILEKTF